MNQKKIGEFLKQLRKEKNMTQEQLAEVSRQYMNTNGILLEPQWLFGLITSDLHHFCTICLFEAWIDDNNNPRLHENVSARVVSDRELSYHILF